MKQRKHPFLLPLIIIILSFLGFWVILIVLAHCSWFHYTISNESLILTFVGILATFIVVSNHMQVKEIKNELEEQLENIKEQQLELSDIVIKILDKTDDIVSNKKEQNNEER